MSKTTLDFEKWTENITVSLWGRGKVTLVDKKLCPDDELTGGQGYKGSCDECKWFMGCNVDELPAWGAWRKGCCWLLIVKGEEK